MYEQNTFAHLPTFLRLDYTKELDGEDVVVIGIPYDLATSNRPGARFGPRAIRAASTQLAWGAQWPWGIDPFEILRVVDYGDLDIDCGFGPNLISAEIMVDVQRILRTGASTLVLGGDHYVTYSLLKAYAETHGPLALIHFDAHSDTWSEKVKRADHGTMFYHATREGLIDPDHSIQVGIRTENNDRMGFEWVTADLIHNRSASFVADRIRNRVGDKNAYLTFDIDCLDPSVAPGTGTPVCGGLFMHQIQSIFYELAKHSINVVGMDVMEVSPPYDHAEITSLAAATIALDLLCFQATART